MQTSNFEAGSSEAMQELAKSTREKMSAALSDDLNTAEALGAVFDMVREANTAADAGQMKAADVAPLLGALRQFDEIFAVLPDDDAEKIRFVLDWAKQEGRIEEASEETVEAAKSAELSDEKIEALLTERQAARRAKNFQRSDEIREQFASAGINLEDTKDGVRWKRK